MTTHTAISILLLAFTSTTGCIRQPRASTAALIKFTRAAQSHTAYEPVTTTDKELLQTVYNQKPELRREFERFTIHTKRDGKNIVILVCSANGRIGLLEDASWTLPVDRKWYKTDKKHPCAFDPTLNRVPPERKTAP
jgi:hypothetical protein